MPDYDPRRSRPTPKSTPDEESAPVDALLGPDPQPSPAVTDPSEPAPVEPQPSPIPADQLPAPVRKVERAPSAVLQMAPAIAVLLAVLLVWMARRRRR